MAVVISGSGVPMRSFVTLVGAIALSVASAEATERLHQPGAHLLRMEQALTGLPSIILLVRREPRPRQTRERNGAAGRQDASPELPALERSS